MNDQNQTIQPRLPGMPPPPEPVWREHTAERWQESDPETYAQCLELIRTGVLNQSRLAEMFGKSRNSVHALMMKEFTEEALVEIGRKAARIGEMAGIDKTTELIDRAKAAKEVGGVAMATKLLHDVAQNLNDKPTSITEERITFSVEDFQRLSEGGVPAISPTGIRPVVEVEVVGSGKDEGGKMKDEVNDQALAQPGRKETL